MGSLMDGLDRRQFDCCLEEGLTLVELALVPSIGLQRLDREEFGSGCLLEGREDLVVVELDLIEAHRESRPQEVLRIDLELKCLPIVRVDKDVLVELLVWLI